jgi:RluA family pseudouridine synthase
MIEILFQNQDLLIVDKPVGISIHNLEDPENLMTLLKKQLGRVQLYPVHRLDKETSGIQVFATNEFAAKKYSSEFQKKSVTKIYVGVLRGKLAKDSGVWNKPLTDKAEGRKNPSGKSAERIPCETQFQVLQTSKYFSLCKFNLITGRQHQIRKHSAIAKHELVGDLRYGDTQYNKKISKRYESSRMYLHCIKLELGGITIESPMPECYLDLFKDDNEAGN